MRNWSTLTSAWLTRLSMTIINIIISVIINIIITKYHDIH